MVANDLELKRTLNYLYDETCHLNLTVSIEDKEFLDFIVTACTYKSEYDLCSLLMKKAWLHDFNFKTFCALKDFFYTDEVQNLLESDLPCEWIWDLVFKEEMDKYFKIIDGTYCGRKV